MRVILLVLSSFWIGSVFGQYDSLLSKKLYSISLFTELGVFGYAGKLPQAGADQLVAGTEWVGNHPVTHGYISDYQGAGRGLTQFGLKMGWKFRNAHRSLIAFRELAAGLSYLQLNAGRQAMYAEINGVNTKVESDAPIRLKGASWNALFAFHTRPFLRSFALLAGFQGQISYGVLGSKDLYFLSYYSKEAIYSTQCSLYSIGFPIGLKYNASCELNIELTYAPSFYVFPNQLSQPLNAAFIHQFGIHCRYKLDTNPINVNNKRVDMFF